MSRKRYPVWRLSGGLDLRSVPNLAAWYDLSDPSSLTTSTASYSGTGTVTCTLISTALTGVGTIFLSELTAGDSVYDGSGTLVGIIASISTDTSATLLANAAVAITGAAYKASRATARTLPLDRSGNGRNLLQAVATKQPFLQSGGLRFLRANKQSVKTNAFTLNQPEFIYAVVRVSSGAIQGWMVDGNANNSGSLIQDSAPKFVTECGGSNLNGPVITTGQMVLVCFSFNGNASYLGTNRNARAVANNGAANMGGICIGRSGLTDLNWGDLILFELAVFSALPAQDQQIVNSLIQKWHIAA